MKRIVVAFLLVILGVSGTTISQAATFQLFRDEQEDLEFLSVVLFKKITLSNCWSEVNPTIPAP